MLLFGAQIGQGVPAASYTRYVLENAVARPSPTQPQEVFGFEELLSELIARAWMLRPHFGSRLVSALLTFGVHCRTLSGEERCGRTIAKPVKSTCTSTTPQLSERAGADACL